MNSAPSANSQTSGKPVNQSAEVTMKRDHRPISVPRRRQPTQSTASIELPGENSLD